MLNLTQARQRQTILRLAAYALIATTVPLLFFGVLKGIYTTAEQAPPGLERSLFIGFANLVVALYKELFKIAPTSTTFLWNYCPELSFSRPVYKNVGFFLTYLVLLLGAHLSVQARQLRRRIAETMKRVEELNWERSMRGQPVSPPVQDIPLAGSNQKLPWFQRPIGLILFGIGLPMVVEVLKVVVGLAKLP